MRKTALLISLFTAMQVTAQVPVTDAGGAGARGSQQGASNELVVSLYNQLEALQNEVLTLRGMVEEQNYQLQRLQTESKDRYLDVDRRLSEVSSGATGLSPLVPDLIGQTPPEQAQTGTMPATTAAPSNPEITPPADVVLDEQELYRTALNLLLEESKYEESISRFQTYVDTFPRGRLLTNALYWQGEAMILVSRFEDAIAVFERLLTEFPQDPKAAGAMLKKGVALNQMDRKQEAQAVWRELPAKYPDNSPEIKAAQDYLRR